MKLMATAIITLFATVALAEGTAAHGSAAPADTHAQATAPAAAKEAHMEHMDKMCEGKKGAEMKKCQEEAKKHNAH